MNRRLLSELLQELLSLASSPRPRCRARAFTRLNLCNSYRLNLWCCVLPCDMPAVSYSVLMMFLAKCLFRTAQKFLAADNKRFKDSTCCTTYSMSMKCIHDSWLKERAFLLPRMCLTKLVTANFQTACLWFVLPKRLQINQGFALQLLYALLIFLEHKKTIWNMTT